MYVINNDINCVTPFVWNFKHSRVFKPGALPSPGQKHHIHLLSSTCFAAAAGRSKFCGERNLEILEIFEEKSWWKLFLWWQRERGFTLYITPLTKNHFNLFLAMFRSGSPLYGHNLAIFFQSIWTISFLPWRAAFKLQWSRLWLAAWYDNVKKNSNSFGGEHQIKSLIRLLINQPSARWDYCWVLNMSSFKRHGCELP